MRRDKEVQICWEGGKQSLLPQITIVKVGGHFPGETNLLDVLTSGSSILYWNRSADNLDSIILTADSIMSLIGGGISIMWSYPNYIALSPDEMYGVWNTIKDLDFKYLYGGWYFVPVIANAKATILKSLQQIIKIVTQDTSHAIFSEQI